MKLFQRLSVKTLFLSIIVTCVVAFFVIQNNKQKANSLADYYASMVEKTVLSFLSISEIPEAIILSDPENFSQENFFYAAEYILKKSPYEYLSFSSNNNVVFVYPYEKHKNKIGTNLDSPEESQLSQIAFSTSKTILYLLYDASSQERLLFFMNPIVRESKTHSEEFFGFITMAYSVEDIISSLHLERLETMGFTYHLQLIDKDLTSIKKSDSFSDIFTIKRTIQTGGSEWLLTIGTPFFSLVNPLLLIVVFLSLRSFYYMYIYTKQKKLTLKRQLNYELYVDSLTGAYNKKKLETLLNTKTKATLIYISLKGYDVFKEAHGQSFADGLLIAYSKRVKYNVKGGLIIHLGVEEFVVFLEGEMAEDAINAVIKRITDLSVQPFSIMGKIANISAMVGHSTMPEDSTKFTSLLNIATERAQM